MSWLPEGNLLQAVQRYCDLFPNAGRFPYAEVIAVAELRCIQTGNILPKRGLNGAPALRQRTARREQRVLQAFRRDPQTSTRVVARAVAMSQSTVHKIQSDAFHKTPVQVVHPGDAPRRLTFGEWIYGRYRIDEDFIRYIMYSDEAGFNEYGVLNCHNEHVWANKDENPNAVRERSHQVRWNVNLWMGMIDTQLVRNHGKYNCVNGVVVVFDTGISSLSSSINLPFLIFLSFYSLSLSLAFAFCHGGSISFFERSKKNRLKIVTRVSVWRLLL